MTIINSLNEFNRLNKYYFKEKKILFILFYIIFAGGIGFVDGFIKDFIYTMWNIKLNSFEFFIFFSITTIFACVLISLIFMKIEKFKK